MLFLVTLLSLLSSDSPRNNPKKLMEKEEQKLDRMAWEMSDEYDDDDRF